LSSRDGVPRGEALPLGQQPARRKSIFQRTNFDLGGTPDGSENGPIQFNRAFSTAKPVPSFAENALGSNG
jgi:hypothetical protein